MVLFTNEPNANAELYTNFFILSQLTVDGHPMINRTTPRESLLLQYPSSIPPALPVSLIAIESYRRTAVDVGARPLGTTHSCRARGENGLDARS